MAKISFAIFYFAIIEEIASELSALHAFKCSITLKKHFRYLTEHFPFPLLLFHYTIYPLLLYTTKHQWCHCAVLSLSKAERLYAIKCFLPPFLAFFGGQKYSFLLEEGCGVES